MRHSSGEEAIRSYYDDICRKDTQAVVAHWEPDGTFADPVGTTFNAGIDKITAFVDARFTEIDAVAMDLTWHTVCGNRAAAHWTAEVTGSNGTRASFQGVTVFTFGKDHLFQSVEEFYNPAEFIGSIVSS
jgi:hypothetical protein